LIVIQQETISNFLSPGIEQIRQSIRDIDDSYNNEWDILAELLQNSVDAIRETERSRGKITIEVDARQESIRIVDDGVGIEPEHLAPLLRPFATKKGDNSRTVGEKGVGLTFAIFASDYFEITTGTRTTDLSPNI
jgi:DNA topoisomerase VI subunit B